MWPFHVVTVPLISRPSVLPPFCSSLPWPSPPPENATSAMGAKRVRGATPSCARLCRTSVGWVSEKRNVGTRRKGLEFNLYATLKRRHVKSVLFVCVLCQWRTHAQYSYTHLVPTQNVTIFFHERFCLSQIDYKLKYFDNCMIKSFTKLAIVPTSFSKQLHKNLSVTTVLFLYQTLVHCSCVRHVTDTTRTQIGQTWRACEAEIWMKREGSAFEKFTLLAAFLKVTTFSLVLGKNFCNIVMPLIHVPPQKVVLGSRIEKGCSTSATCSLADAEKSLYDIFSGISSSISGNDKSKRISNKLVKRT